MQINKTKLKLALYFFHARGILNHQIPCDPIKIRQGNWIPVHIINKCETLRTKALKDIIADCWNISLFHSFHRTQRITEYRNNNRCDVVKEHPYSQISPTDNRGKQRRRVLCSLNLIQNSYIQETIPPQPLWSRFDLVKILPYNTSHMKHLILRGIFNSHRYNIFVFEYPVCIKNKYIYIIVYTPEEIKDQTTESWPKKLSNKEDNMEMTANFSRRNN
jgi:hypothetical protein